MNKAQKKMLKRIVIGATFYILAEIVVTFFNLPQIANLGLFLVPYFVVGHPVLLKAWRNIKNGQVFDENFLMTLATIGALCIGEYPEAVFVMLFYQVGELFEKYAVGKSRNSIADLMDICPDYANLENDGKITQVDPSEVNIGDIIIVKAGEKIPLDGIIIEGESSLDTVKLTGESVPRDVKIGDSVVSGCVNLHGMLKIKVTHMFSDSTVSKILNLVENSAAHKAKSENFITKFARYYTPAVVISALIIAFIPPIFVGNFASWIHRALIFLVISCPCALVISVPLSFFGGIGGASRKGILVKGANYLESLAKAETVVFDKTGTLTKGDFSVKEIHSTGISENELIKYASHAESFSNHPVSVSLKTAYGREPDTTNVKNVREIAGCGIIATIFGDEVAIGNGKLMQNMNIDYDAVSSAGTVIYVAINGKFRGYIVIADTVKDTSETAIKTLKKIGIKKTVMLSGDNEKVCYAVANKLQIDEYHSSLLPEGKVNLIEKLIAKSSKEGKVVFVGDGINDAPTLMRADIGIAMGAFGSDAAIEAADIVLMNDNPEDVATSVKIARKTLRIVYQNIIFALSVKLIVLLMGTFGIATMWEAVFADVGVSVIAILNAMRTLRK